MSILFGISLAVASLWAAPAAAAELRFVSDVSQPLGVGQEFQADLMLDAEGQLVNTVAGRVALSPNVEVVEAHDGDSIVSLWVKRPSVQGNMVSFSGVMPGGFQGVFSPYYEGVRPGKVISVILRTKSAGAGFVGLQGAEVLLHDGKGTAADVSILPLLVQVAEEVETFPLVRPQDTSPPEEFTAQVSRNDALFEGQYFLVFNTQDKDSGVAGYQVQEVRGEKPEEGAWKEAASPYLLEDQRLSRTIFVKAIDRAGNERVVTVELQDRPFGFSSALWWVILGAVLLAAGFLFLRPRHPKRRQTWHQYIRAREKDI